MAASLKRVLLLMSTVLMALSTRTAHAMKASSLPRWENPQACEWDLKICGDGTWVHPDPTRACAFPDCWVAFQTPPPASTGSTRVA